MAAVWPRRDRHRVERAGQALAGQGPPAPTEQPAVQARLLALGNDIDALEVVGKRLAAATFVAKADSSR